MTRIETPKDFEVAIDVAHAALLYGMVLSLKPRRCIELGIGSGYATQTILDAIARNGVGNLICVDSFQDWNGVEPPHIATLRSLGANVCRSGEREFLASQESHSVHLLVSDADHAHSGSWVQEHLRVLAPGSVAFFHDTSNGAFLGLRRIPEVLATRGIPFREFTQSTTKGERCERGWLMALIP